MLFVDSETIDLEDGQLRFWPAFLGVDEAQALFVELRDGVPWEHSEITIAGQRLPIPRLNAWYGDAGADYSYSGITLNTLPFSPTLAALRQRVEIACDERFNSALVNLYRDHRDSVDWHADDEPELGSNPVVASVSLGSERRFELRRKDNHRKKLGIVLPHGSLLLMTGKLQHFWHHRVGKESIPCNERINITLRRVNNPRGRVTGAFS